VSPYSKWATCTTGNATDQTATCGYGGHGGAYSQFYCDFSKCEDDHEWHIAGSSYKDWMMTVDPEGFTATDADSHDHSSHDSAAGSHDSDADSHDTDADSHDTDADSHDTDADSHDHDSHDDDKSTSGASYIGFGTCVVVIAALLPSLFY